MTPVASKTTTETAAFASTAEPRLSPSLFCCEMCAPVLRVRRLVLAGREGMFLAKRNRLHLFRRDSQLDQVFLGRLRSPIAQGQVVLLGPSSRRSVPQ